MLTQLMYKVLMITIQMYYSICYAWDVCWDRIRKILEAVWI